MAAFLFGADMFSHLTIYDIGIIGATLTLAAYVLYLACKNNKDS